MKGKIGIKNPLHTDN